MWIVTYKDKNNEVFEERFDNIYEASQFMMSALKLYDNIHSFKETFSR